MKYADIQRLHEADLITAEQRQRIIEHFGLREDSSRFLVILSMVGATLVSLGLILLIGANWDDIPDAVKIGSGITLMVAAHAGGWWLREHGGNPRSGDALHLAGALLFLANIALVGQIYHISSRLPAAWLCWWIGIAPLPWILRSRPLHLLSLVAFGIWFGTEIWSDDGWLQAITPLHSFLLFSVLGIAWYGFGLALRATSWRLFSHDTERLGLTLTAFTAFPLFFSAFHRELLGTHADGSALPFWMLAVLAAALVLLGALTDKRLPMPWRQAWAATLGTWLAYLCVIVLLAGAEGPHAGTALALSTSGSVLAVILALVAVRVGVQGGSAWLVNTGIFLIGLAIVGTYLSLVGSMARTGAFFIVSGVLIITLGLVLERKRRSLLHQIHNVHAALS